MKDELIYRQDAIEAMWDPYEMIRNGAARRKGNIDGAFGILLNAIKSVPAVDAVEVVKCKDCKHNPKDEWFGCPMAHLSEKQRPETVYCWKGERREIDEG